MRNVLIYSEDTSLAVEILTAGKKVGVVKAVCINDEEQAALLAEKGVEVYAIQQNDLVMADSGAVANILQQVAAQLHCPVILISSNRRGKLLAGRLAQKINAGCLTGINNLRVDDGKIICERNVLGGAVIAEQIITREAQVLAVLPKSFPAAEKADGGSIHAIGVSGTATGITLLSTLPKRGDAVDISAAETLFVVGQGIESQDDLLAIEAIAKAVNGEVACTKPVATDRKWFSEDRIIGISGKSCKPTLAVLLGVSGQVQFYAGIREAKTIVTINFNENAPIMSMADYLLNADLNEVVPALKDILA